MGDDVSKSIDESDSVDPRVDFLAGTVAGAAGLLVGQPFDTIKVRFQSPQYKGRYASTWGAFGAIIREESPKGLFKGVTSPMAGIAFINGVIFTSYGTIMKLQIPGLSDAANGNDDAEPSLLKIGIAGAGSGLVASLLSAPTELIKIRQQSAPTNVSLSTIGVFKTIIRTEGIKGLYRGWTPTAMRELAYGPYFITYEGICRYLRSRKTLDSSSPQPPHHSFFQDPHAHGKPSKMVVRDDTFAYTTDVATAHVHRVHHGNLVEEAESELGQLGWGELMLAGGLAGMVSWSATFPLDVLKTRMQAVQPDATTGKLPRRISIIKAARQAVRTEGIKVFWSGLAPTLLRAFPSNCVVFLTFEAIVAACK